MSCTTPFPSLQGVVGHLPFPIEAFEEANRAYVRWHREHRPDAKRIVDLWTYCFIRQYFLLKFARREDCSVSDLELVVEQAYRRVEERRCEVRRADCYAHWVSVVCKNVYLNYLRTAWRFVPLHEGPVPGGRADPVGLRYERLRMFQAVQRAIGHLPDYLREIAYLRFVQECSYQEIREATGKPLPILRSYVCKVRRRLRGHAALRDYLTEWERESA